MKAGKKRIAADVRAIYDASGADHDPVPAIAVYVATALAAAERAGRIAELEAIPCWCVMRLMIGDGDTCNRCRRLAALRAEGGMSDDDRAAAKQLADDALGKIEG